MNVPGPIRTEVVGEVPWIRRVVVFEEVESTSDELRALAADGAEEGTVVLADRQTRGRGRLQRRWDSPAGLGLYFSVLLRPGGPPEAVTRWTLAAGLAACEACRRHGCPGAGIRWPNDLIWRGRKLGGVLAELRSAGGRPLDLVLGIGINVSQQSRDFPPDLRSRATSLQLASPGSAVERDRLAASCLELLAPLTECLRRERFDPVAHRWEELAVGARGQRVRVLASDPDGAEEGFRGVTEGVDDHGALRVRSTGGVLRTVHLAESVRPI